MMRKFAILILVFLVTTHSSLADDISTSDIRKQTEQLWYLAGGRSIIDFGHCSYLQKGSNTYAAFITSFWSAFAPKAKKPDTEKPQFCNNKDTKIPDEEWERPLIGAFADLLDFYHPFNPSTDVLENDLINNFLALFVDSQVGIHLYFMMNNDWEDYNSGQIKTYNRRRWWETTSLAQEKEIEEEEYRSFDYRVQYNKLIDDAVGHNLPFKKVQAADTNLPSRDRVDKISSGKNGIVTSITTGIKEFLQRDADEKTTKPREIEKEQWWWNYDLTNYLQKYDSKVNQLARLKIDHEIITYMENEPGVLVARLLTPRQRKKYIYRLKIMWFGDTSKPKRRFGFRHVFVGEIDETKDDRIQGLHNWYQFYRQLCMQPNPKISDSQFYFDYELKRLGMNEIEKDQPNDEEGVKFCNFEVTWNNRYKYTHVYTNDENGNPTGPTRETGDSTMLFGARADYEFAIYTLCFHKRASRRGQEVINSGCRTHMGDKLLQISGEMETGDGNGQLKTGYYHL